MRCDDPDVAEAGRHLRQGSDAGTVNAVVVGNQNTHVHPPVIQNIRNSFPITY